MTDVGIGWCLSGSPCPEGVECSGIGALAVLSVPRSGGKTARARLLWQVTCFESGLDFLPVSPRCAMTVQEMAEVGARQGAALRAGLEALSGRGQLTLALSAGLPPVDRAAPDDGWLRARQARRLQQLDTAREMERGLAHLVADLPLPSRFTQVPERGAAQCHLLVPRTDADAIRAQIGQRVKDLPCAAGHLDIAGLWPAFAFAELPQHPEVEEAA